MILRVSVQQKRKVNAWRCAPATTDHDLAGVILDKIWNIYDLCIFMLNQFFGIPNRRNICNSFYFLIFEQMNAL